MNYPISIIKCIRVQKRVGSDEKYHAYYLELDDYGEAQIVTKYSDDYTRGTKFVMRQIRVWSRGMGIVL